VAGASDTLASDAFIVVPADGSATPDALAGNDVIPASDVLQTSDVGSVADVSSVQPDSAPVPDASTVVTSTSAPDNTTDPTICSTVVLGDRALSADQTYDIVMPDCLRLSGTITLDSPLPAGAVFANGIVNAFKIIRDSNNAVADTVSYAAFVTPVDATHFTYTMGVPADTYEMMYHFIVKSAAQIPSTADRVGQEHLTISGSLKHDVTLPAIDVVTRTVTVTGTQALVPSDSASLRMVTVTGLTSRNTLKVDGINVGGGASVPIAMWVPNETITPFIMVHDSPGAVSPFSSGFDSLFKLDSVTPTADFSLALPAVVKISGTVSDPFQNLTPMQGPGGIFASGPSYYHCDNTDTGGFPDPIFVYPEFATSSFFSASTSHAAYAHKGLNCITNANYAIATGAKGAIPTNAGENTYAFMQDPTPKSPNAITLNADITRNVVVPDLGPQVTVTGTVKDARGAAIPNAHLNFNSRSLVTAAVADKTFVGNLDVASTATYALHALPGTYAMWIALTKTAGSAALPDAGVVANKDAGFAMPDVSFSLPDLGIGGGDCTGLAACCATLSGSSQTACNAVVSTGMAATCSGYLSSLKMAGSCS